MLGMGETRFKNNTFQRYPKFIYYGKYGNIESSNWRKSEYLGSSLAKRIRNSYLNRYHRMDQEIENYALEFGCVDWCSKTLDQFGYYL